MNQVQQTRQTSLQHSFTSTREFAIHDIFLIEHYRNIVYIIQLIISLQGINNYERCLTIPAPNQSFAFVRSELNCAQGSRLIDSQSRRTSLQPSELNSPQISIMHRTYKETIIISTFITWFGIVYSIVREHMPQSGQTDPRFVQKHTQKSSPAHDNFLRGSPGKVIFYGSRTHYFFSFYKELFQLMEGHQNTKFR